MTRRLGFFLLALLFVSSPLLARRRAVTPGAPGHCTTGRLAIEAYTILLTSDGQHVYWIDDTGYVVRASVFGDDVEGIAELDEATVPLSMTVDATHVYISALTEESFERPTPGMILSVPKTGGVPGVLVSGVATGYSVETDATHLYWAAAGTIDFEEGTIAPDGKIERVRKDGSNRETLAGDVSGPIDLALEGGLVWLGQTGLAEGNETIGLYTVPKNGGAVATITDEVLPAGMTLTPTTVFAYGAGADSDNAIFAIARDGSSIRSLVDDPSILGGLQVADGQLYYVTEGDAAHSLFRVAVGGGTPALVRDDLYFTEDYAIDACGLIFGTADGQLLRIAR